MKAKKTVSSPATKDRNYSMSAEDLAALKAQAKKDKAFPNPYRAGSYHHSVAALATLGANQWHPLASFVKELARVDSEWIKGFKAKENRNENGKDIDGRILQNLTVIQRVKDY